MLLDLSVLQLLLRLTSFSITHASTHSFSLFLFYIHLARINTYSMHSLSLRTTLVTLSFWRTRNLNSLARKYTHKFTGRKTISPESFSETLTRNSTRSLISVTHTSYTQRSVSFSRARIHTNSLNPHSAILHGYRPRYRSSTPRCILQKFRPLHLRTAHRSRLPLTKAS